MSTKNDQDKMSVRVVVLFSEKQLERIGAYMEAFEGQNVSGTVRGSIMRDVRQWERGDKEE